MTRRPAKPPPSAAVPAADAGFATPLHSVSTNVLAGMIEAIAAPPYNGRADLPALAEELHMEADELLPLGELLQTLRFAELEEGDIRLTEAGRHFAQADTDTRKSVFAAALRAHVPLAAAIRRTLEERWNHRAAAVRFRDELEDHMSPDYADETLRAVINWGRYAELFSYDEEAGQFSLEDIDTAG